MINWYVLFGLIVKLITMIALLIYVVPIQHRELKRPVVDKRIFFARWTLFFMVAVFETLNVPSISYQISRLHTAPLFNLRNVSSVTTNIGVAALGFGFIVLYVLAGRLARKK